MKKFYLILTLFFAAHLGISQCTITLSPGPADGKDAWVFSIGCGTGYAMATGLCDTSNFGASGAGIFQSWTFGGTPGIERSFMEFDFTGLGLAPGCSVSAARLVLTPIPGASSFVCGDTTTLYMCDDNSFFINRVTSLWDENVVNWLTQPPVASTTPGEDFIAFPDISDPYGSFTLDIAPMVNFWLANPSQNFGFRFALQSESGKRRISFASSDYSDPAYRPRLELDIACPAWCGTLLKGKVFDDSDSGCDLDPAETGLNNWLVEILPGPFYATTDVNGDWSAVVGPSGTSFTVNQLIPNHALWDSVCPLPYQYITPVLTTGDTLDSLDFALHADFYCPQLWVDIVTPFFRPFHITPFHVRYCNLGNDTATGVYINVALDPALIFDASTMPHSFSGPSSVTFYVGTLLPGECADFIFTAFVNSSTLGQSLCVEAEILPVDSCVYTPIDTTWDRSSVSVDGGCVGDSLACFTITNTGDPGTGDMAGTSEFRIYEDGILVYVGTFMLCGGCDTTICWPAAGHTIRLEADQRPGHPGSSHPNANVEDCGDLIGGGGASFGFVTTMPDDDADDNVEIFCDEVRAGFDPNDKTNWPGGIDVQHFIEANTEMEYRIRFQNTGTDTAFNIVLLDTLDANLDLVTLKMGASSHPYTWRIFGPRVLEVKFDNILLPDSNVNEPLSHGFVKFTIDQVPDLLPGTEIRNRAGIYFDHNPVVMTNQVLNTIWDNVLSQSPAYGALEGISLAPNPTEGQFTLTWQSQRDKLQCTLMDATGRVVLTSPEFDAMRGGSAVLDISNLADGVYFLHVAGGHKNLMIKVVKL